MEEKLIKAIKSHPCIFDRSSTLFRNKTFKEQAWHATAISTGASVEHCKQRWKSLRDRFVREVASQQSKSLADVEEKSEWCYFELMRFLTKHVTPRKAIGKTQWCMEDQPSCSYSPATSQSDSAQTTDFEYIDLLQDKSGLNDSLSSFEAPKSENASKRKRLCQEAHKRVSPPAEEKYKNKVFLAMLDEFLQKKSEELQESRNAHERFNHLCRNIETMLSAKEESKNKVFLAMLDELLQKKSEEVQEKLKMEILNHVHNS